ncbi:BREX-1 system adenine-specific DNA-methyltransferase PglX [Pseudomonas sp. BF-R-30]|uniref:BREX-1 system adenine-specific DNA-methyltransferase PglX n=1 Tax=Pseudomonas sp. BF-R-30 TaxID=2832384 RepID=UPI001CBB3F87|nr:BREX-1 system adenine-specific DNA-methyltransferase PglX [Pseudomonas sp. BF-R-30]
MNTNTIKRYAPKARTAFIATMTKRAALFGIRESSIPSTGIEPLELKGDLALIGDRPFPANIIRPRAALVKKVEQMGFTQAMEQAAYSWFNRLCAIRYMELKGYLDHGRRVLSHPEHSGGLQILDECLDVELEGLDKQRIAELKLDGTKDEELYRELLLAQCHALHQAMPFLFEAVDDALELLLPDNLTKTDSLIRELINAIPEEDWQDVEIIGWLYQFYISEKKDQVIGKVVKSEDIPAATQLFTPNWIVQYLVQNSVGRQWLQTYPDSPLKAKMPYYIEPAEQTPEVKDQLAAITPESIDPLTIKVLDPACGSGHILVEAYKVLKAIYEERGHRSRDIPQLILEHNLFGLDIDDRAGQLAGFALMMLAREDDRRIFTREVKLNVLSLQESSHLDLPNLWKALNLTNDWQCGQSQNLFDSEQTELGVASGDNRYQLLKTTLDRFIQAKTFGSLIEVPAKEAELLGDLLQQLRQLAQDGDVMQKPAAEQLIPYVLQAWVLAQRYDAVVANPPYMGHKGLNSELKKIISEKYEEYKTDLFSVCASRFERLSRNYGSISFMTPFTWMFLKSFEQMRTDVSVRGCMTSLIEPEYHAFFESAFVPICAFSYIRGPVENYKTCFIKLSEFYGMENQAPKTVEAAKNHDCEWRYDLSCSSFEAIPGRPFCYSLEKPIIDSFREGVALGDMGVAIKGLDTCDNDRFMRLWHEVSLEKIGFGFSDVSETISSSKKWFPYSKGGPYRKWYGNYEHVVNWEDNGREIKDYKDSDGKLKSRPQSTHMYFKKGLTFGAITSSDFSCRYMESSIFGGGGNAIFVNHEKYILGLLNSVVCKKLTNALNPTLNMLVGDLLKVPIIFKATNSDDTTKNVEQLISIQKEIWDSKESSWEFKAPIFSPETTNSLKHSLYLSEARLNDLRTKLLNNEEKNDRYFCDLYNINYKKINLESSELNEINSPIEPLISYALACIMGRYSLDRKGLVYAHAGNEGFAELVAEGAYKTFPADTDGILPLTDQEWFADDATNRFREFVRAVWGEENLQENLDFVAESLCLYAIKPKRGESALDSIRRYLCTQFFKDHLKSYKKRPIYWLFSSGKHKAFECLVYLHRYNERTLARMRTEYVIPLTAKLNTYTNKLEQDIVASTSTAEKKALEKQLATLHNQQAELATFDEKLRHYADQRISLDLDKGVKVNYGRFGDLLAEVKVITGGTSE